MTLKTRFVIPNTVSLYIRILKGNELDWYQNLKIYKIDVSTHAKVVEKGRIFKFLQSLDLEYDDPIMA